MRVYGIYVGPRSQFSQKGLAKTRTLVITNNGKPTALMLGIDSSSLEETLASLRQAEAMRLLNNIQLQSVRSGTNDMTLEEIDAEIAATRAERTTPESGVQSRS